jgi:hypothetical protein
LLTFRNHELLATELMALVLLKFRMLPGVSQRRAANAQGRTGTRGLYPNAWSMRHRVR